MLATCSWAWGLTWNVVHMPNDSLLEKTDSVFQSVSTANNFLVRGRTLCPLHLRFCCLNVCRSCTCCLWEFVPGRQFFDLFFFYLCVIHTSYFGMCVCICVHVLLSESCKLCVCEGPGGLKREFGSSGVEALEILPASRVCPAFLSGGHFCDGYLLMLYT